MAKTGINFERANVGSAKEHNKRDKDYIKAVNESPNKKYDIFNDRSGMNVFWEDPKYAKKTLPKLLDEMRGIYREHIGQSPQEDDRVRQITDKKTGMKKEVVTPGWAPIREGICPIKEDTKIEDFEQFNRWLKNKGPKVIGIYLHRDEGYTDLVTGERKYNHHAHIVVDWIDHETGKTYKLSKIDASEMQTQIALSLGMERGESKVKTGADHLTPDEYRAKAQAEEFRNLREASAAEHNKLDRLQEQVTDFRQRTTAAQKMALKQEKKAKEADEELQSINSRLGAARAEIGGLTDEISILRWLRELRDMLLSYLRTMLNRDGHRVKRVKAAQRCLKSTGGYFEEIFVEGDKAEYKLYVEDDGTTHISNHASMTRTTDSPLTAAFCRELVPAHHEILAASLPLSSVRVPGWAKILQERAPIKAIETLQAREQSEERGQGQGGPGLKIKP